TLRIPPPPTPTLFPYTTLFRSGPFALSDTSVSFVVSNLFSRAQISADVTVTPDTTAPTAIRAVGDLNFTNVTISFSERVSQATRSEEHTSELQSRSDLVCRLLL